MAKTRRKEFVATLRVILMIEVPVSALNLGDALDGAETAYKQVEIKGGDVLDIEYGIQGVSRHDLWMD